MIIRNATKFDSPQILNMIWNFRDGGPAGAASSITSEETPLRLISIMLAGGGIALVSEQEGKLTGMLLAIKAPHMWDNSIYEMHEIMFWVEQEHRGSTAGYRLINAYVTACDDLKDDKQIVGYSMSQMNGQKLKYERFGFKRAHESWSA